MLSTPTNSEPSLELGEANLGFLSRSIFWVNMTI